jgi:hypothetical protein
MGKHGKFPITPKFPEKTPNKKRRLTWRTYGSDWWPCRVNKKYRDGYDNIKWNKE